MRHRPIALGQSDGGIALLSQALALQQAKDFEAAEAIYRRFLRLHPPHVVALNNAALVAKALAGGRSISASCGDASTAIPA